MTDSDFDIIPSQSLLLTQSLMLALRYGFKLSMPFWVTWFPCLFVLFFIGIIGLVLLLIAIATALFK